MANGKLLSYDGKAIVGVNYKLLDSSNNGWWGELTLAEYMRLADGDGYVLETEDGRQGGCTLRKKVNKAVQGLLPLYCYHFRGNGELE